MIRWIVLIPTVLLDTGAQVPILDSYFFYSNVQAQPLDNILDDCDPFQVQLVIAQI